MDALTDPYFSALDLAPIHGMVAADLTPLARQRELKRAWSEMRRAAEYQIGVSVAEWRMTADESGYTMRQSSPKHRYVGYLGAPYYVAQLVRRSRYLRDGIIAAERAWCAPERRWPRGLGFNWPRRPARFGLPHAPLA